MTPKHATEDADYCPECGYLKQSRGGHHCACGGPEYEPDDAADDGEAEEKMQQ